MTKELSPKEEGQLLAALLGDCNRSRFAREFGVPGGGSMISQNTSGNRPISLDGALAYSRGLGVPISAFSPRIAAQLQKAGVAAAASTGSVSDASEYPTSTVRPYSVKNHNLAPVFAWAMLGEVLFTESSSLTAGEYREKPEDASPLFKWFIADTDMPRLRVWRGWRVAIEPIANADDCIDMRTYLFRTAGGGYFLGDFRRTVDGYEALPDSGPPLDSVRHGITVVGVFNGCLK